MFSRTVGLVVLVIAFEECAKGNGEVGHRRDHDFGSPCHDVDVRLDRGHA